MNASRYIVSGLCDAATNMAVDEALLNTYEEGSSKPILRIYGWRKAAFSFGYSQDPAALFHLDLCEQKGVPVVRRPTGGGIIFHNDDVTYSIIISQGDLQENLNVKGALRKITLFLTRAYQDLGVRACFAIESGKKVKQLHAIADFCFSRNEDYDILIKGKKIGGNAQKRKKRLILQHGSIPFSFEKEKIAPFLKNSLFLKDLNVACINEITDKKISFTELSDILKNAFGAHFSTALEKSGLSEKEQKLAEQLKRKKYAQARWNLYREQN